MQHSHGVALHTAKYFVEWASKLENETITKLDVPVGVVPGKDSAVDGEICTANISEQPHQTGALHVCIQSLSQGVMKLMIPVVVKAVHNTLLDMNWYELLNRKKITGCVFHGILWCFKCPHSPCNPMCTILLLKYDITQTDGQINMFTRQKKSDTCIIYASLTAHIDNLDQILESSKLLTIVISFLRLRAVGIIIHVFTGKY